MKPIGHKLSREPSYPDPEEVGGRHIQTRGDAREIADQIDSAHLPAPARVVDETWWMEGEDEIVTDAEDKHVCTKARGWSSEDDVGPGWVTVANPVNVERTRLMACAPELARLLIDAEFAHGGLPGEMENEPNLCPWCDAFGAQDGRNAEPHKPDCRWLLVMQKAGLR